MKQSFLFYSFVLLTFLLLVMACTSIVPVTLDTPDCSILDDGIYRGSNAAGMVSATVDVTVQTGRMTTITIIEHRCGLGKPAEAIVNQVIERQSLAVDAVTGATRSSQVILKALQVALQPQNCL